MTKKKIILIIVSVVLIAAITPFIFLFSLAGKEYTEEYLSRIEFNKNAWSNLTIVQKEPYPRIKMIDDLLNKHNLKNKTKKEILTLLGNPEETGYFKKYEMVYWLGPERNFISIDSEWLVININDKGIVDEYAVYTD